MEIRTLDEAFPELKARLGFHRPYLKLDTQGFDLQVLQGGPEVEEVRRKAVDLARTHYDLATVCLPAQLRMVDSILQGT